MKDQIKSNAYESRYDLFVNGAVIFNPDIPVGTHIKYRDPSYFLRPADHEDDQDLPLGSVQPDHGYPIFAQFSTPRTGCNFVRAQLQNLLGIYAGFFSISGCYFQTDQSLLDSGLYFGTDPKRFFYSATHYFYTACPADMEISQAVILVRDPFEFLESSFRTTATGSHVTTDLERTQKYQEIKDAYFKNYEETFLKMWEKTYEHLLQLPVPKLILKFDEYTKDPQGMLRMLSRFIFRRDDLEGTIIDAKLKRYQQSMIYKPVGLQKKQKRKLDDFPPDQKSLGLLLLKLGLLEDSDNEEILNLNEIAIREVCNQDYVPKKFVVSQPPTLEEFGNRFGEEAMKLIEKKEDIYLRLLNAKDG